MAELPRGTVTLLFTDVEASTELVRRAADSYEAALEDHRRFLRSAVAEAGGHEVDCRGEEFSFAFPTARDAVTAAIAGQRLLAEHQWPDGIRIKVRMGIHTGEPSARAGGYVGVDVHRAARICSLGHGGQILVSQTTRDLLAASELPGAALKDLGAHQLKGLAAPEPISQVVGDGLPSEFPPLRDVNVVRSTVASGRAHRLRQHFAPFARRKADRSILEALGWRVRELLPAAPGPLQTELAEFGGVLFSAGRALADLDRQLAVVDRAALARRHAQYRDMAVTSKRAGQEADSIAKQMALVDRLTQLRAAVGEDARAISARVERLAPRLPSEPPTELAPEIEDVRRQVSELNADLERALGEGRAAAGNVMRDLKRTRHRGIYRDGARYVVRYLDELGVESHREFDSLDEAREFRAGVRLAQEKKTDFVRVRTPPRLGGLDEP